MEDENELILGSEQLTNESFTKEMNNELNRMPNVSTEEHEEIRAFCEEKKNEYANSDKKTQFQIQQETLEKAQMLTVPEEFKKQIAQTLTDTNNFGHDIIGKLGDMAGDFQNIANGTSQPIFKDKVPGYEMSNGEWMSMESINDMLSTMKVDQGSKEGMKVLLDDVIRKAENIQPGDDPTFNYQKEYNNIKNKIVETGDLKSLTIDKIFPNRTFKDDLISAIKQGTYKEMGIDNDQVQDPTPDDGKITEEDAKIISNTIIQNEDMLKEYLAEYYTKALEQNYNNNLSMDVKNNENKKNKSNKEVVNTNYYTPKTKTWTTK
tara:strand:+ start:505 stop:1464 length:960 start_codon:yes stop_codon:yes gene_type:complete